MRNYFRASRAPMLRCATLALLAAVSALSVGVTEAEAGKRKQSRDWRDARASIQAPGTFSGIASFYGSESGNKTASGQRFNQHAMTAAHRTLPFGTKVRVTHKDRSVVVTINDRGPFIRGRVIDLSKGAAHQIGLTSRGIGHVTVERL